MSFPWDVAILYLSAQIYTNIEGYFLDRMLFSQLFLLTVVLRSLAHAFPLLMSTKVLLRIMRTLLAVELIDN